MNLSKNGRGGTYLLLFDLPSAKTIEVGRLGFIDFPAGRYAYTGSAKGGLEARLARHFRKEKKLHWHIDYLLEHSEPMLAIAYAKDEQECSINRQMMSVYGWQKMAKGFGSSDCRCYSHLHYLGCAELKDILDRTPPGSIIGREDVREK